MFYKIFINWFIKNLSIFSHTHTHTDTPHTHENTLYVKNTVQEWMHGRPGGEENCGIMSVL